MSVYVLDRQKQPLMPCSEKRARKLLQVGRAKVHRIVPFTIRLTDRRVAQSTLQPLRLKIDPGSRVTGLAVVRELTMAEGGSPAVSVVALLELHHRGMGIRAAMLSRSQRRRQRRGRLRHRPSRYNNRRRPRGWLPPSLKHRIETTRSWVQRLQRWAPLGAISQEVNRFDLQKLENPEIQGVEYQQGTLAGYEVREYLLEKFERRCVYCNTSNVPLQIDHIQPKSRGGTDRVSNLTLACARCNQRKGARPIEQFLARRPALLRRVQGQAKACLRDAAVMNATRWKLAEALRAMGLPLELWSGGRTKWNRTRLLVPKTHALDAACVGNLGAIHQWRQPTLVLRSYGRGKYRRTIVDGSGFPRAYRPRTKRLHGFATGDLVLAVVTKGKKQGRYVGRVTVTSRGIFTVGTVHSIHCRYCRCLQRSDGYGYSWSP